MRRRLFGAIALGLALAGTGGAVWYFQNERGVLRGVILNTTGYPSRVFFPAGGGAPLAFKGTDRFDVDLAARNAPSAHCVTIEAKIVSQEAALMASLDEALYDGEVVLGTLARTQIDLWNNRESRACRLSQARRVRGVYGDGYESSVFHPVGSSEVWWVEFAPGAGSASLGSPRYREATLPVRYACVDFYGLVTPRGAYGHLGGGQRDLVVLEVIWSSPQDGPDPSTCRSAN